MKKPAALFLVLLSATGGATLLAGCSPPDPQIDPSFDPSFKVRESIEQLAVTHATPGTELALYDVDGKLVQKGNADSLGSLVFRLVPAGIGYTVRTTQTMPPESTRALRVLGESPRATRASPFYSAQQINAGSTYIQMRDGTLLAAYVTLPGPPEKGPYPTVVNYSGYDPAKPGEPYGDYAVLCDKFPALCDAPSDPSALVASLFGYATVGVNMRGTGCSGGAYDFLDTLQKLDSYDVIEAVAAQPWVLHNKVGMTGISYPGFSQLFVAAMQPPSLAAITPLSVMGDMYQTLDPGGILNSGFAVTWAKEVLDKADPYGQGWEKKKVDAGDTVCAENQLLHGQKVNLIDKIKANPYYRADFGDPIMPVKIAPQIKVPVFLACAFQDEQTGPFYNTLFSHFTGSPLLRVNLYNGVHVDGFAPQIMVEWKTFLDLYVAQRVPSISAAMRGIAPQLFKQQFGASIELPPDRFDTQPTWEAARAAYEKELPVRVLFESGAKKTPGSPESTFEQKFSAFPPAETRARRYYLTADGALTDTAPTVAQAASSILHDPEAGMRSILAPGGNVWDLLPAYNWQQSRPGYAATFLSAPLTEDLTLLGTASVDLWVQSTATDGDLQATITEVRPDGQEVYVQSGWLRLSQRKLAPEQTDLWPAQTHLQPDVAPLPAGQWSAARIGIPSLGHVFRSGSRFRLTVDTPGGTRAAWRFQTRGAGRRNHPSHRPLGGEPVEHPLAGGPRRRGTGTAPGLPIAAWSAVPSLYGADQYAGDVAPIQSDQAPHSAGRARELGWTG